MALRTSAAIVNGRGSPGGPAMRRIHRHYVALRLASHRSSAALHEGAYARLWFWGAWHVLPFLAGLRFALRQGAARPGRLRELVQLPWFAGRLRVDPDCYYRYRLDRRWSRRSDYLFHDEIIAILGDLNARFAAADVAQLDDKRRFFALCARAGLPTVPILAEFERGQAIDAGAVPSGLDLFSKYANRYCGEGASLWTFSDGMYTNAGLSLTLHELKRHLAELSSAHPVVLQPRVVNAPALLPISGKGLSTARVITMRCPGGAPEVALASYRMATGDQVADNFAAGGVACPIALESGVLGAGVLKSEARSGEPLKRHPDSDAPIEGRALPHWEAVKALAIAAHDAVPAMPSVGWDIAITAAGPLLLEGNAVWCVDLAQMSHGRPLAETPIAACLARYLDAMPEARNLARQPAAV